MVLTIEEFEKQYPNYESLKYLKSFFGRDSLNNNKVFPIKPTETFLINCNDYWCQPYRTDDGKSWVIVQLSDWSLDLKLKDEREIVAHVKKYHKYSKFNFKDKYLTDIDFIMYDDIENKPSQRSDLTHQEYLQVLKKEHMLDKWEREEKIETRIKNSLHEWINETPHVERPYKLYVVGCDDASYTMVYDTKESVDLIINSWKSKGFINDKKWDCVFTN